MMALLDVTVFVRTARVGLATVETVVAQQTVIAPGEVFGVVEFVHGGRETVGLMRHRHATQLPQRRL